MTRPYLTDSGIPLKRFHTPQDLDSLDHLHRLGEPGEPPFTRGIYRDMYRDRPWTMRQYAGFGSAETTNQRFKFLINSGQTGLSTAFDLPTQLGMDSDNDRSQGEVGRVGVAINTIEDMQILFDGVPLNKVSTSMTINAPAGILTALYMVAGELQGVPLSNLRGTTQNDILKEFVARNTFIYPPEPSLRLAVDVIEYCSKKIPHWHPISISGYHMREAGATAVQELAFTFSNAIAYVSACIDRGIPPDSFLHMLSFFFVAGSDFFEEIAKFRAARRLWGRLVRERFGAKKKASMMLRFHTQTSGESLTAQQPENNIVRVALQGLSAILGGTQSLHTNSMDEALSLPTERAARTALRTQQLIAFETGVTKTVDPLGGAYYVEYLTTAVEEAALKEIDRIDSMGGVLRAIESGYIQNEIQESAYRSQKQVEKEEKVIVGVNRYNDETSEDFKIYRPDAKAVRRQLNRLRLFRKRRSESKSQEAVASLQRGISSGKNSMPYLIDAVRKKATLGEISDALRELYGEYRQRTSF